MLGVFLDIFVVRLRVLVQRACLITTEASLGVGVQVRKQWQAREMQAEEVEGWEKGRNKPIPIKGLGAVVITTGKGTKAGSVTGTLGAAPAST